MATKRITSLLALAVLWLATGNLFGLDLKGKTGTSTLSASLSSEKTTTTWLQKSSTAEASPVKKSTSEATTAATTPADSTKDYAATATSPLKREWDDVVVTRVDPPIFCLPPTAEECVSLEYWASECGHREWERNSQNPNWTCADAFDVAEQAFLADPNNTSGEVIVMPDTLVGPDGSVTEHVLERELGVRSDVGGSYYEWDDYAPPGSLLHTLRRGGAEQTTSTTTMPGRESSSGVDFSTAQLFAVVNDPVRFDAAFYKLNGPAVASCEEYAYEAYWDFSEIMDRVGIDRDPEAILNEAISGPNAVVTPSGGMDMRNRIGNPVDQPDSGTVLYYRSWFRSRVKNVYYYLDRRIHNRFGCYDCENHHVPTLSWHLQMRQEMQNAGYLTEELERLRRKQDEIYDKWNEYQHMLFVSRPCSNGPFPNSNCLPEAERLSVRQAAADLLAEIEAEIEWARDAGFIPEDPNVLTPCDWAPGMFAEPFVARYTRLRRLAFNKCEEVTRGDVNDNALHRRFVQTDGLYNPNHPDVQQYVSKSYTANTEMLEEFFVDIYEWAEFLYSQLPFDFTSDGSLRKSEEYSKSAGNDMFEVSFHALRDGGIEPNGHKCSSQAESEWSTEVGGAVFGNQLDAPVFRYDGDLQSQEHDVYLKGSLFSSENPSFQGNMKVFDYDESFTLARASLPPITLPAGPVEIIVRAGIVGKAGVEASLNLTGYANLGSGGVSRCDAAGRIDVSAQLRPWVSFGGFVSATAGITAVPIKIGLKVELTVIEVSLPANLALTLEAQGGEVKFDYDFSVNLDLQLLRGILSLVVVLDFWLFDVEVLEIELVRINGPRLTIPLIDTGGLQDVSLCLAFELQSLFGRTNGGILGGCNASF